MRLISFAILLTAPWAARAADPREQFFESKIRPALLKYCSECHAGTKTKGGLSLDGKAGWEKGGDSGPAVVPGKPDDSLLIKAIRRTGELHMPPGDPLPGAVTRDFEKWVADGAFDPRKPVPTRPTLDQARGHWAFRPLPAPDPAPLTDRIDAAILAGLKEKGLDRSPPADARVLVRRVFLDLLGVPPTPEDVATFLADPSDVGYARLVDRLLADPRYGERQARWWLDVARFAESSGYEHDNDRPHAYTYRDFVIRAFNADMPFDQFARWQIAGDRLAPEDRDAVAATGFLAAGVMNGQVTEREAEAARYEVLDDWVGTVGTAFFGLTVGCARCHDHKFDPIDAADYYRLAAYFAPSVRTHRNAYLDPSAARAAIERRRQTLADLAARRTEFEQKAASRPGEAWRASRPDAPAPPWLTLTPAEHSFARHPADGSPGHLLAQFDDRSLGFRSVNGPVGPIQVKFRTRLTGLRYLRVEALTDDALPNFGPGTGDRGNFSASFALTVTDAAGQPKPVKLDRVGSTTGDKPGGSSWGVGGKHTGQNQAVVFRLGSDVGSDKGVTLELTINSPGDSPAARQVIGRFRVGVATADSDPDPLGFDMPHDQYAQGVAELDGPHLTPAVLALYCLTDPEWVRLRREEYAAGWAWTRPAYEVSFGVADGAIPYRMMIQGPDRYPSVHVLSRGDPERKSAVAAPAPLPVLTRPGATTGRGGDRADLARWLTDSATGAGALTARVAVNRIWQTHFGRGIVGTPSDFGTQGDPPTHPALLDELAAAFARDGWSAKRLHRAIVMSRTYRQAGEPRSTAAAIDPENALLWRFPPRRLEAEAIRDSWLAVSGRLDASMFGPGTLDERSTRRSVYFTVKRSRLIPMLTAFDWPEALTGIGRRPTTVVAPQALLVMNHPEVRASARAVADRTSGQDDAMAVARIFDRVLARPPTPAERDACLAFLKTGDRADLVQTLFMTNEFVTLR
jgi:cytochrome c553